MAKKYNSKSIDSVSGLTTKDILEMDVYSLNTKSLRKIVNRVVSSANKRIRRLEKESNQTLRKASQSYSLLQKKADGKAVQFTIKNIPKNDLQERNLLEKTFKKIKTFLQSETSTIKGTQSMLNDLRTKIDVPRGEDIENDNEFWDIYNEWIRKQPNIRMKTADTNELVNRAYDLFKKGKTKRAIKTNLTRYINKMSDSINKQQRKEDMLLRDAMINENGFTSESEF